MWQNIVPTVVSCSNIIYFLEHKILAYNSDSEHRDVYEFLMRMTTIQQSGVPQFPAIILPFLFFWALDLSAALPVFHTHRHHRISFI